MHICILTINVSEISNILLQGNFSCIKENCSEKKYIFSVRYLWCKGVAFDCNIDPL